MARSRGRYPQRQAARRGARHAAQSVPHHVLGDARRSEGLHASVEDQLSAVSPARKEPPADRVQVRAVHRGTAVRQVPQAGSDEMKTAAWSAAAVAIALTASLGGQAPKR